VPTKTGTFVKQETGRWRKIKLRAEIEPNCPAGK